jgi:hypothetical protein
MRDYVVAGVPRALVLDGWWIEGSGEVGAADQDGLGLEAAGPEGAVVEGAGQVGGGPVGERLVAERQVSERRAGDRIERERLRCLAVGRLRRFGWVLLALVGFADFLFWDQAGPGLSLAVFLWALAAALRLGAVKAASWAEVLVVLAVLPLVERVQGLSFGFGILGVAGYAVWLHSNRVAEVLPRLLRLPRLIGLGVGDGFAGVTALRRRMGGAVWLRATALPVGMGLCFASLLIMANPVLAEMFSGGGAWPNPARGLFWLGIALVIWPLLAMPEAEVVVTGWKMKPRSFGGVVNAGAVKSSLWLFNAMFAVQTGMDAFYLWGGADLPAGMSHAEYAHRGAYPLLVTALLAGAFALISRVYAAENPVVKGLLLVWLGQNVLLVGSSLLRLEVYVESFGMTYLRAYAAIWMAVVAVGLVLVGWQVLRGRGNGWLSIRCAGLGLGVLYACCFVNFAGGIAKYNLAHSAERFGGHFDRIYNCNLGEDAWGAFESRNALGLCAGLVDYDLYFEGLDLTPPQITGWRDWSYRSYRVLEAADAYSDRG